MTRRVCIVSHAHPDLSKGGGETAAYREFRALRDAGIAASFVAAADLEGFEDTVVPHGPEEYLFAAGGMTPDRLFWADIADRREVVRHLAESDADVFHFHHFWRIGLDLISELMDQRPDARFVVTMHEFLAICMNHGQMVRTRGRELCRRAAPVQCTGCFPDRSPGHFVLRRAMMLQVLRRFDAAIFPSRFARERYRAWGFDLPRSSVLENYLGDELMAIRRQPDCPPFRAGCFGFFGQPTEFKGLDILIRGFAIARQGMPGLTLSVFGCERDDVTNMFPAMRTPLDEAGAAISFYGRYDQADVLHLMQTVGWLVVPSIWWENSPVVIQEAMRAGTPLIVSDIGGMAEKVRPGLDGLHFKRGSPIDLGRVLTEAADPAIRDGIGATLSDTITAEAFLTELLQAFRQDTEAGPRDDAAAGLEPADTVL